MNEWVRVVSHDDLGVGGSENTMPKHIVRLMFLICVFAVVAVVAKSYFTVDSFYRYGHYRADSVPEIAADEPKYQGPDTCLDCHEDRHVEWTAGRHKVVICEVCHGPAGEHPVTGILPIPDDTVRLCTLCHEAMPARPAAQPQIVVAEHAGEVQCITCHNPHSPRIGGAAGSQDVAAAAGADQIAADCVACHGADGLGVAEFPPLAGKDAEYLAGRLRGFKSGALQDPMMNTIMGALSDREISDLAAYYAALPGQAAQ